MPVAGEDDESVRRNRGNPALVEFGRFEALAMKDDADLDCS